MGHCKYDNIQFVGPKNDVERKSTKNCPAEVGIERWKSVGRIADEINQAVQLIEKSRRGTDTPFGVPSGSFIGIPQRCRMEPD